MSTYDYLKDNGWTYPIICAGAEVDSFDVEVEEVVAMRDMLLAFEDPVACVKAMAHADVKIVSLTITELGYRASRTNGTFPSSSRRSTERSTTRTNRCTRTRASPRRLA